MAKKKKSVNDSASNGVGKDTKGKSHPKSVNVQEPEIGKEDPGTVEEEFNEEADSVKDPEGMRDDSRDSEEEDDTDRPEEPASTGETDDASDEESLIVEDDNESVEDEQEIPFKDSGETREIGSKPDDESSPTSPESGIVSPGAAQATVPVDVPTGVDSFRTDFKDFDQIPESIREKWFTPETEAESEQHEPSDPGETAGPEGKEDDQGVSARVAKIDRAANKIHKLGEQESKCGFEIGRVIKDEIFAGDLDKASSKNPAKDTGYQLLLQHDLISKSFHPTTLSIYTRGYALQQRLLAAGVDVRNLTMSMLRVLISLSDREAQKLLAQEIIARGCSVREAQDLVKAWRLEKSSESHVDTILKKLATPERLLKDEDLKASLADPNWLVRQLDKLDRGEIRLQIVKTRRKQEELRELLDNLDATLAEIDRGKAA
jgi:hypothetical protein